MDNFVLKEVGFRRRRKNFERNRCLGLIYSLLSLRGLSEGEPVAISPFGKGNKGLLRRFAPRNDRLIVIASLP